MIKQSTPKLAKVRAQFAKITATKKRISASSLVKSSEVERKAFAPGKYPGKIEITQGYGVIASLSFEFGERLKEKPIEVRRNDIYADARNIDALRVGTQYRHKGYATQLMTELINYAKKQNKGNIYLRVNKHNSAAVGLYNKLGFKVVRDVNPSEQLMAFYIK